MTVAFDAVATQTCAAANTTTPLIWTHTPVGTPSAVGVWLQNVDDAFTVTGITYGGVAMSIQENGTVTAFNGVNSLQVWGLANPPSGAQSIIVTGTINQASNTYMIAASRTVTGSDLSTCFRTSGHFFDQTNGVGSASYTLTGVVIGDLVADINAVDFYQGFGSASPGGGQTQDWGSLQTGTSFSQQAAGSYESASGTSVALSWNECTSLPGFASFFVGIAAAAFKLASVAVSVPYDPWPQMGPILAQ